MTHFILFFLISLFTLNKNKANNITYMFNNYPAKHWPSKPSKHNNKTTKCNIKSYKYYYTTRSVWALSHPCNDWRYDWRQRGLTRLKWSKNNIIISKVVVPEQRHEPSSAFSEHGHDVTFACWKLLVNVIARKKSCQQANFFLPIMWKEYIPDALVTQMS